MANIEILEQKLGGVYYIHLLMQTSNTIKGDGLQFVSILMSD